MEPKKRRAVILAGPTNLETVQAYMPSNYTAMQSSDGEIIIEGYDDAGWTLDGYVIPRWASGLICCGEVDPANVVLGDDLGTLGATLVDAAKDLSKRQPKRSTLSDEDVAFGQSVFGEGADNA